MLARSFALRSLAQALAATTTGCATVAGVALGATLCGGSERCTHQAVRMGAQLDAGVGEHALRDAEQRVRRAPAAHPVYRCRHLQRAGVSTLSRSEYAARRACGGAACEWAREAS